jgi:glycosyltransferase involved in cell wall biosynthesis
MIAAMQCPDLSELPPPLVGLTGWPWTQQSARLPEKMPDGKPWPKLSVVMRSLNDRQFLEPALRSVLLQGYPDIEFIVVDGGSTDGSVDILRKYEDHFSFWVSEWDAGDANALNKGIERSTGDILYWLKSDCLVMPDAFGDAMRAFARSLRPRIVSGAAAEVDDAGNILEPLEHRFSSYEDFALHLCSIEPVATFLERKLFDEHGLMDVSLEYAIGREFLLRVTKDNPPFLVPELFAARRGRLWAENRGDIVDSHLESDRVSLRFIAGNPRIAEFHAVRAAALLGLVDKHGLTISQRFRSLIEAARLRRRLLGSPCFYRRTLAAMKATITDPRI